MSVIRVQKHTSQFVILNKKFLEDMNLSLKLKGFLAYCLSKPDHWQFRVSHLASIFKEGKECIWNIIKEGISYGYIEREYKKSKSGTYESLDYIIHETPILKEKVPHSGFPCPDNPSSANPTLVSNDNTSKETMSYEAKVFLKDNVSEDCDIASKKSYKQSSKTLEPQKRFRLTREQQGVVDWLKDKVDTEEKTLCYWAKTHSFDKIKLAYHEALAKKPKNLGGYLNDLLKFGNYFPEADRQECIEFVKEFSRWNKLEGLKICKDYLNLKIGDNIEQISLNQKPETFVRQLNNLFNHMKRKEAWV